MKTRKVAAFLPLMASIGLGIVSLAVPFLLANHYIFADGTRYSADNYLFFLWGKYYTVAGANMIQSKMVMYSIGDFPMYALVTVIIGLLFGIISMFAGRGIVLNIKGRTLKLKLDTNPVWLQIASFAFLLAPYLYLNEASKALAYALIVNNYIVESGPSIDFLLGSLVAMAITIAMTIAKSWKENRKSQQQNLNAIKN
jgi:hypothetical protein